MLHDHFSGTSLEDDLVNFSPALLVGEPTTPRTPDAMADYDLPETPQTPYATPGVRSGGGRVDSAKSVLDAQEAEYFRQQKEMRDAIAETVEQQRNVSVRQTAASLRLACAGKRTKKRDLTQGWRAFRFGLSRARLETAGARAIYALNAGGSRR